MKRTLLLLIILAIAVTLATSTVAVYTLTLPSNQSDVGNKVFNLFSAPPYEITEPQYAEDAPTWRFKVFTSTPNSGKNHLDLYVNVTLNTTSTAGLSVALVDTVNGQIDNVNFSGNSSVQLYKKHYVRKGETVNANLQLVFSYNGSPLSPTNTPFSTGSVQYTVDASAY